MPSTGPLPPVAATCRNRFAWLLAALLVLAAPAWVAPSPVRAFTPAHTGEWSWPVEGPWGGAPEVLRGFDPPQQVWLPGHRGVDLAANAYDLVRAAGPGTVTFAGPLAGRGVVSIEHSDGLRTTYEPVDATVQVGEPVSRGSVLGLLEPLTTHCIRACLHWGLRRGDTYLDPLTLIDRPPPILLPYGPPLEHAPAALLRTWWP